MRAHHDGKKHREVSIFILDEDGERVLLQKRSKSKYHSGGLWSNSCCTHQYRGENIIESADRCLKDELGISKDDYFDLTEIGSFSYYSDYGEMKENEYDHVYVCKIRKKDTSKIRLNPDEVEEIKFVEISEVRTIYHKKVFTSWFLSAFCILEEFLAHDGVIVGEKKQFFYAYEGREQDIYKIDIIDRYETPGNVECFKNYISNLEIMALDIRFDLKDYIVDVSGDVVMAGDQNDMKYFMMNTYRDFRGLIDGYGNERFALLCSHYHLSEEFDYNWMGLYQRVLKTSDKINEITLVIHNYNNDGLSKTDKRIMLEIIDRFEESIGYSIGIVSHKHNQYMQLLSVRDFVLNIK